MAKILVVEDDKDLSNEVQHCLRAEKHVVESAENGTEALELLRFYKYDLVILDWELPGASGLEIIEQYRSQGGKAPVLFLTGRQDIADKERGLDSGADDYLTKPFSPRELLARLRALLRRPQELTDTILRAGDICLEVSSCRVTKAGEELHLTPREFSLLEFLLRHPDTVFSAETLLDRVWASESDATSDTLRAYITKLRSKIDSDGRASLIRTVHRLGYKLETPE